MFYTYSSYTIILIAKICSSLAYMCAFVLDTMAINLERSKILAYDLKYYIALNRSSLK